LEFGRDPLNYLTWCARQYGDVVYLRVPFLSFYLINHPDLIEEVLVTNNRNFIKDKGLRMRPSRRLFGNGLLTSDGDFWIRQRRLAQPAFHREQIATHGETMVACTERMIETWQAGQTRDIHQDLMHLTLEIVCETLFGIDATHEAQGVSKALDVVAGQFASQSSYIGIFDLLPTPGYRRFERAAAKLDEIIYRIIRQRRGTPSPRRDLLSLLLEARDEDGVRMSDQQLRDEAMTLFLAGHETTALALSWTWFLLAQHPEAENRLIAELKEKLGGRAPSCTDLPHLRFTEMVIMEATLILATIAQRFHLALAPGQEVKPLPSITLRPRNGVRVIVTLPS
jgi:cytochrome P450